MSKLKWWHYYMPLRWTIATRYINIINIINIISFLLIDAIPSAYIVLVISELDLEKMPYWLLSFYTMFCFYECGYIFNEVISVRYEKKPTIRIPEPFFSEMPRHLENLLTIRLAVGTIGSWLLLNRFPENKDIYIVLIMGLLITYSINNFFRGKINIFTMGIEVSLKYIIPISLFIPCNELLIAFFIIFLSIVLVRLIEYISKKKFISWIRVTQNVDVFRIKYYFFISILVFSFSYYELLSIDLCGLPIIFLFYRLLAYYAMHHVKSVSEIINKGRKHHGTDGGNEV